MWPILRIDARTQTEAAPGEQTEMRCRSANQSLITDVLALRPYFCTIQPPPDRTAKAVRCQITTSRALDGGHQILQSAPSARRRRSYAFLGFPYPPAVGVWIVIA